MQELHASRKARNSTGPVTTLLMAVFLCIFFMLDDLVLMALKKDPPSSAVHVEE